MTDNVDDIFDMMDRIFGRTNTSNRTRPKIQSERHERQMDEDNIYYTLELREFNKEDINVMCVEDTIRISFSNDKYLPYNMKLPYPIIEDDMKVSFRNGILDIICPINKKKSRKLNIN